MCWLDLARFYWPRASAHTHALAARACVTRARVPVRMCVCLVGCWGAVGGWVLLCQAPYDGREEWDTILRARAFVCLVNSISEIFSFDLTSTTVRRRQLSACLSCCYELRLAIHYAHVGPLPRSFDSESTTHPVS